MTIRLVTFDLDDTLWEIAPVIHSAEALLRDWFAESAPRLGSVPVEHLWAIRDRLLHQDAGLKHRVSELRRRVIHQALLDAGYVEPEAAQLAEAGFAVYLAARQQVTLFEDVHPTLEQLADRYTLGVLTNGNADVHTIGLADYFRFALNAEQLGIGKPDPMPFREALRLTGIPAEATVHVGDNPVDDVQGAQQAGIRAVWFNPLQTAWQGTGQPDAEIRSLSELPELLAAWSSVAKR
ncbi:HAD family hydrolase [Pseudomonas oryzihabitans]|uniref:HAD family hydrolase n=1 Tax=Pseudomonas oryzihabitans TaxID=47885 RepID=UPI00111E2409|nr:HAD-IA family hydrolase [Pseudomonas psychrotolerans]MDR6677125.1 putative hydrolase of the HAD superfamily [Pseudomonas psychrotolerans]QDD90775.1 HAD family hydrolase [Pseudomonas psychrotolerans]